MENSIRGVLQDTFFLLARIISDIGLLSLTVVVRFPLSLVRSLLPRKRKQFKSIFITGASVGLGSSLAKSFAKPGSFVFITARSIQACDETKLECEKKGATCIAFGVDVRNSQEMKSIIELAHQISPLDLVIANAGCTAQADGLEDMSLVLDTNVLGTVNTIVPAIRLMREEKITETYQPQIALMSSLGGYGSGGSLFISSYCASKNAIRILGESLRVVLSQNGIGVTVIFPGMTESRMVSTQIEKGIKMSTSVWSIEKATNLMVEGIRANDSEIYYPFMWYLITRVFGSTPSWFKEVVAPITRIGDPYHVCDLK